MEVLEGAMEEAEDTKDEVVERGQPSASHGALT